VSGWKMARVALQFDRGGCVSALGLLVYTRYAWCRALRARRLRQAELRRMTGRSLRGTRGTASLLEAARHALLGMRLSRGGETGAAGVTEGSAGTPGKTTYG